VYLVFGINCIALTGFGLSCGHLQRGEDKNANKIKMFQNHSHSLKIM